MPDITRRQILTTGAVAAGGLATAITAGNAQANTQKPVAPERGKANPDGKFKDKVVLITGATSGIGEGTAYAFAKEGAKVFFCGRREDLGKQVEAKIKGFGGEATYQRADVRREEDVKNFVEAAVKKYGRLDIAFNNAGIATTKSVPIAEQSSSDFLDIMTTNAAGVFYSIDFRFFGESGGATRQYESPRAKTQDIKNAVTYLQTLPVVDANQIGGLGVCASAGYMAYAVAEDTRLQSFALIVPWLHEPSTVGTLYQGVAGVQRRINLSRAAREQFEKTGVVEYVAALHRTDKAAAMVGDVDYYANPQRGGIPEWKNQFAVMSWEEWLTYDAIKPAASIRVPTLVLQSDKMSLLDGARKFYEQLNAPKDIFLMQGTRPDFYDQEPYVNKAVQASANHFRNTLTANNNAKSSRASNLEE